jgi:hypothetical protein
MTYLQKLRAAYNAARVSTARDDYDAVLELAYDAFSAAYVAYSAADAARAALAAQEQEQTDD